MPKGPVIGPMVIAAVLMDEKKEKELVELGAKDSKMLTPKKREFLFTKINEIAKEIHYVIIPAEEIDDSRRKMSLNELEAMKIAKMIVGFANAPERIFIDIPDPTGMIFIRRMAKYADIPAKITAEHKADVNYPVCSAASIIAKVTRDREIEKISEKYGNVGSGYPADPNTIAFLKKHKGESLPFVRYSWETAKNTIGRVKDQKKLLDY